MTATDYRQVDRAIERCNAELRGIANRLHEQGDQATARIVDQAVDELDARLHEIVQLRNRGLEAIGKGR